MTETIRAEFAPALMTRDQASYYLSMSVRDLERLRYLGDLTPVGGSKRVKYRKADLDAYVDGLKERAS